MKALLGLIFVNILTLNIVEAKIINVPADQPTIQAGIDAVIDGDTVLVAGGTYYENITMKEGVTVQGAGAYITTISAHDRVIIGADNSIIDGFTITNDGGGNSWGYGPSPSSTIIRNNVFTGHYVGIHCGQTGSKEQIINNVIIDNNHSGITFGWDAAPIIMNNIIMNNNVHHYDYPEYGASRISAVISYNNLWNGIYDFVPLPGTGNISVDPLFFDSDNGDLRLQSNSPCIGAGLDGVDMGVYFYGERVYVANEMPVEFQLLQNYPNPFNPVTTIKYNLPQDSNVILTIYNVSGQRITVLTDKYQQAGNYSATWNATGLPSGLYFCTLRANGFTETRKMVLVK